MKSFSEPEALADARTQHFQREIEFGEAQEDLAAHKIAYSTVDEKTERVLKLLRGLVDVAGLEPATSSLRTRRSPN